MSTGGKLAVGAAVIVGVTGYMAYVGASASWKYYLTVDECLADTAKFAGQRLRVSGQVAAASLRVDRQRSKARFALAGAAGTLPVECTGPLPDNLAEEIEVVVEGRLDPSGRLQGDKLLTRCASKYERGAAEARTARARTAPRGEVR